MCLGKLLHNLPQENDNSGTVLGKLVLKFCRMDLLIFSSLSVECAPHPALVNTPFFHLFINDNLLWDLLFYAPNVCLTNIRCRGVAYGSRQDKDASKQGCMLAT